MNWLVAVFLICQFLLAGPACATRPTTEKSVVAIFYLEEGKRGCAWVTQNLANGKKNVFYRTTECPSAIVWDLASKQTVYENGGDLYSIAWDGGAAPELLGSLLDSNEDYRLVIRGGALRVASLVSIPEESVVTREVGGATVETYHYEGKEYEAKGLVDWGERYMAVLHEYENKTPRLLLARPTKSDAGGTPGLDVIQKEARAGAKTIALSDLLRSYTQYGYAMEAKSSADDIIEKMTKTERERIVALLGFEGAWENLELDRPHYMSLGSDLGLLIRSEFGDTPHFVPPVYTCSSSCAESRKLALPDLGQLAIRAHSGHVLVAGEFDNADASVFRLGETRPSLRLPNALYVVFQPFEGFWETFSRPMSTQEP